jgi:flagellar P-ring protein precursor FlgI
VVFLLAAVESRSEEARRKARVKDVASIEGIRDNQLVGYGLVVGLHGTGDSKQTIFPKQTLVTALQRMGIIVPQSGTEGVSNMQVRNVAAVFIVATLPPFSTPGSRIDITVSSVGDARSIEGGILVMTSLYGPDGQIYAEAQGALVLGGYSVTAGGGALRFEVDAYRRCCAERCRFPYGRADGGSHQSDVRLDARARLR